MNTSKEDEFNRALGHRLMISRVAKKMSLEYLGAMIGVRAQQVHKYETGENRMSPERIDSCAKILEVSVSYLYGENDITQKPRYHQKIMTIAAEINAIENEDIRKSFYFLARSINEDRNVNVDVVEKDRP